MDTDEWDQEVWQAAEARHRLRVESATAGHRSRRRDGRTHPVEDFLFAYYAHRPAQLRRWHPGTGVRLNGAASMPRASWRFYATSGDGVALDLAGFVAARGDTLRFVRDLLTATAARDPQLGCFGLHEWAMVYRASPEQLRHSGWPLRLGRAGIDEVIETHQIRCTHYDAFRFYTAPARSLNVVQPTRETQGALEQPGCLHAGMDCYKWAFKLSPGIRSELVMDCFELAREIRELDMRASPYDLADLGYPPVRIETPAGRAEYVRAQLAFAERAQALRRRLVAECDRLLSAAPVPPGPGLDPAAAVSPLDARAMPLSAPASPVGAPAPSPGSVRR